MKSEFFGGYRLKCKCCFASIIFIIKYVINLIRSFMHKRAQEKCTYFLFLANLCFEML